MAAQGPVVGVVCVKKIRKGTEYAPQSASMHFGQVQTCLSLVFKDFLRKIAFFLPEIRPEVARSRAGTRGMNTSGN